MEHPADKVIDEKHSDISTSNQAELGAPQIDTTAPSDDGGIRAWSTVVGAWFILFATYGYIYAFGVYQDYYVRIYLSNHTPSQISWIGSIQYMSPFFFGMISGKLFDKGYFHSLQIIGGLLFIFSLFMLSLAKPFQYYQIFLSQGLGMGLGLGLTFMPTIGITSHHFRRRRALAGGIALSGSAVGAIIFPILLNNLLRRQPFGESVRASAYLVLGCLVIGNAMLRTQWPTGPRSPPNVAEFFREPAFNLATLSGIAGGFGVVFPVFYLQLYAVLHGLDLNLAFYSLAILNAASIFGRVIGNHLADIFGPFNILAPTALATGGSIFLVLVIRSNAALVAVSIIYGFFSGAHLSLTIACCVSLSKRPSDIGAKTGIILAISAFGFLGSSPSQGALLTDQFYWIRPIVFSGTIVLVAALLVIAARFVVEKERGHWKV